MKEGRKSKIDLGTRGRVAPPGRAGCLSCREEVRVSSLCRRPGPWGGRLGAGLGHMAHQLPRSQVPAGV